jgi:hypothetical protein
MEQMSVMSREVLDQVIQIVIVCPSFFAEVVFKCDCICQYHINSRTFCKNIPCDRLLSVWNLSLSFLFVRSYMYLQPDNAAHITHNQLKLIPQLTTFRISFIRGLIAKSNTQTNNKAKNRCQCRRNTKSDARLLAHHSNDCRQYSDNQDIEPNLEKNTAGKT